jgi:hypothetical protein
VKNGGSKQFERFNVIYGGNVKNAGMLQTLGALALLGAGLVAAGCKSAPELSQSAALAMVQADYDQAAPVPTDVVVNDLGMREGVTAKYWEGIKKYPNGYWADFKLTPDGAKLVKLAGGGDVIEWRPDGPSDPHFSVTMTTVAASHPKAVNPGDVEDNGNGKTMEYSEDVNLDGLPDPLQGIAHNPGNTLSTRRHANFVLANGAWKLDSIN